MTVREAHLVKISVNAYRWRSLSHPGEGQGEGYILMTMLTPHPALRADLSPAGRGERRRSWLLPR
ncbi:hypothetical protein CHELA1G2_10848 [Hyphomicrobiales bacterium]|nr:hypothetical protein CHELA1G2_10848 [Hyphomicrobiales bacterium]